MFYGNRTKALASAAVARALSVVTVSMVGCAGAANAQDASSATAEQAAPAAAPEQQNGLEDIVVTARRVSESLQTTGVSIEAFSSTRLESLQIQDAQDLSKYTPNLDLKARSTSASQGLAIKIRGIGVSDVDYLSSDPSVAVYIDGVFQARAFGPQFELFDLERIEVLRGPQGTLYGKNSLGGAINIITRKPDGDLGGNVEATVGNYGRVNFSASVNVPIVSDKLFASFAATSRTRNSFYKNTVRTGLDPGDESVQAMRGALRWLPGQGVTVDVTADWTRQRQNAPSFYAAAITPGGLAATALAQAGLNPANFVVGIEPSQDRLKRAALDFSANVGSFLPPNRGARGRSADDADFHGVSLAISGELGDNTTLRSFSSYRHFKRFLSQDIDGTPAPILDQIKSDHGLQFTQELQLNTELFDNKVELVLGGFGLRERLEEDQTNGFVLGLADATPSLRRLSPRAVRQYWNTSLAGFGHAIFRASDSFRLIAGIRYSWEEKSAYYRGGQLQTENVFQTLVARARRTFDSVTPMVGVEYELNENVFTYGTISKGYASGGFAARINAGAGGIEAFDPESLWNYEVGVKTTLFDRKLRFNIAAFRMDYANIVVQSFGAAPAGSSIGFFTKNAGRARVQGIEADMVLRPAQPITITAGLGLLDQKFLEFGLDQNGNPIDPNTAHFFDAPSTNANAVVDLALPLAPSSGTLTLSGDWAYRSRTYFDNTTSIVASQDPFSLFGARLAYRTANERTSITVFGENLTNKVYAVRTLNLLSSAFGTAGALFGPPRTFGVRFSQRF